jgi:transposase-like protein
MWTGENESAKFWLSVLNELRNRGVYDLLTRRGICPNIFR